MAYVPLSNSPLKDDILAQAPALAFSVLSRQRGGGKDWERRTDLDAVLELYRLMADGSEPYGLKTVILNGTHLLTYSISSPWYNPSARWLVEQFFIRIRPGHDPSPAYAAIEEVARDEAADTIVLATAFAPDDEALGETYSKYGYTKQSTQHIKQLG